MRCLAPLAVLAACASTQTDAPAWEGGDFEVTVTNGTDMCLGGAFEDALLPEDGVAVFEAPMELPGVIDLPWVHTVDFLDPFGESQVTFEVGEKGEEFMQALDGALASTEYDPVAAPGCFVDATVDYYLQIVDDNSLVGSAVLHLDSFDEDACPEPETELCDARFDLTWQRI